MKTRDLEQGEHTVLRSFRPHEFVVFEVMTWTGYALGQVYFMM